MSEAEIASRILHSIILAGCVSPNNDWVDLDKLWVSPETFESFSDLLAEYLSKFRERTSFNKIVAPNKVYGPFGILPIAAVYSAKAKIPLIIWKEWAKPATGGSLFFGSVNDGDKLLILHDVVSYGATVVKEKEDLLAYARGKKCEIVGILTVVVHEQKGIDFINERAKIPVKAIVSWEELVKHFKQ